MSMSEIYEPPIPYTGNKRLWRRELTAIARALPQGAKVIDAYGGSGLVSQFFKAARPDLTVMCNDSDNYQRDWIPVADQVKAWHSRWWEKEPTEDNAARAVAALARAIDNVGLAEKIARGMVLVSANGHGISPALLRKSYPDTDPSDYCVGVKFCRQQWGPQNPIPRGHDLIILDPPYNTVAALDSTFYGTRREDPPISLWAAQEAFKSRTPAICWGRDGWLVDYPSAVLLAEKFASRGHNREWLAANPAAIKKYHLDKLKV